MSLKSILMLSFRLRLGNPSGLFPSGFPTKALYAFLYTPVRACMFTRVYCSSVYLNLQIFR
jgi:hypothetical protein